MVWAGLVTITVAISPAQPSNVDLASGRSWSGLGKPSPVMLMSLPAVLGLGWAGIDNDGDKPSPLMSISPPAVLGLGWAGNENDKDDTQLPTWI